MGFALLPGTVHDSSGKMISTCFARFDRGAIFLLLIALGTALLSGCSYQQLVREPYPAWGDETEVTPADSNIPLVVRTLYPQQAEQAKACLLLVHGMNEHIGRYQDVARHFVQQNFIVSGFDYDAHGLSNPVLRQADDRLRAGSAVVDVSDAYLAQAALDDLEPARKRFKLALEQTLVKCHNVDGGQNDGGRPVFVVAHSLGGLISATFLLQHQQDIAAGIQGIVFLGPGFSVSEVPGWRGWFANPIIRFSFYAETHFMHPQDDSWPLTVFHQTVAFLTVPLLDGLFEMLSWPGLRTIATPVSPEWVVDYLTDDAVERQRLRDDNWIVRRALLRYVKGIEDEIVQFRRDMHRFAIPYYLVYSAFDPITTAWGSDDFIYATLKNHPDNEYLLLSDSRYHQHLFMTQPRKGEILQQIEQWLDRRINRVTTEKNATD